MYQARRFAAPALLFLSLLIGGSTQGVWTNAILRLIAIVLIAWAVLHMRGRRAPTQWRSLGWLVAGVIGCGIIQLVPLPFAVWASLPGHGNYAADFELLGIEPGWMTLSLAPYDTVATMLALLPALGMLAAVLAFRETARTWLVAALIAGAIAGVFLGILQVSSSNPMASPWYLYRQSNFGVATGFFANGNHMATLLLACIPFIAALAANRRERTNDPRKRWAILVIGVGGLAVAIVGLALNGSLAGYSLAVPVLIASLAVFLGRWTYRSRWVPIAIAIAVAVIGALLIVWSHFAPSGRSDATGSIVARQAIFGKSADLVAEYAPLGSGIGTFDQVYRSTEDPQTVDRFYVNHAHNDYLEVAVEAGLAGVALILLFLAWWVTSVRAVLRSPSVDRLAAAASIASGMILLHSMVDYPLRTAAIRVLFAMCLGLIMYPRRNERSDGELRPVRHLVVS